MSDSKVRPTRHRHVRGERGAVAAEAAVVVPVLALVCVMLAWLVGLGVAHVRAVDAAREVARSLARGDSEGTSLSLGRQVAPEGARFTVDDGDNRVRVRVRVPIVAPAILDFLPRRHVSAEAVALQEDRQ